MKLSLEQKKRFMRQINLPEVGRRGQKKIIAARVLIVGAGGLGSPAALYLASAGVGTIGIAEDDKVEISNLQRQILYGTADIGREKNKCAAKKIRALNPVLTVQLHPRLTDAGKAAGIIRNYDFVIDATDNLRSKFIIAEACHRVKTPCSYAGGERFAGQTMTVLPRKTACLFCIYGGIKKQAERKIGPMGFVPGILGIIQAAEAIKYILNIGQLLTNRLLTFDALVMNFRTITVKRNKKCTLCGNGSMNPFGDSGHG